MDWLEEREWCNMATMFSVDLGVLRTVDIQRTSSWSKCREAISPTASLFHLKGLNPLPLDIKGVEYSTESLKILCRSSLKYCEKSIELNLLEFIPDLIFSPDVSINIKAIDFASGLVAGTKRPCCGRWMKIIYSTLVKLEECVNTQCQFDHQKNIQNTNRLTALALKKKEQSYNKVQNKERAYHGLCDIAGQQPFHDSISKEVFPSGIRHWALIS